MSSWFRVETAHRPLATSMAVAVVVAASFVVLPGEGQAQARANAQAEQSRALAGSRPAPRLNTPPATGRYVAESGESFIFDRSGTRPLFRFERRSETWVLRPTPAPRGDIIYRNDAGDQILRVTPDGGMTLYSVRAPSGSAASRSGEAPNLAPPTMGPIQLFNLMASRSSLVSDAVGRLVQINLSGSENEALCAEALIAATDAVIRMARSPSARAMLGRLRAITIVEGSRASIVYARGELRVTVDPSRGLDGRPSSARIIQAMNGTE